MKRLQAAFTISLLLLFILLGCNDRDNSPKVTLSQDNTQTQNDNAASGWVCFDITVNKRVYEDSSNFGEPPQIAVWLENPETGEIKTVWVSYRSATGDWIGKIECPVALPYWFSRFNKEMNTSGPPSFLNPAPIAITGATPETNLKTKQHLSGNQSWLCFIEVNVSADYNRTFSSETSQGMPDSHGNGQPSLIYKGLIDVTTGNVIQPKLVGRTEQFHPTDKINPDLEGITTAKDLLETIKVTYYHAGIN